jgi:plastocyanin
MNLKATYCFACSALAFAVVLAGCFSERVTAVPGPSGAELCAGTQPNVVRIRDYEFGPGTLTVPAGTTVTFVNCGDDAHTATSDAGVWDSQLLTKYVVYQREFAAAGTFPYHCNPHPFMTGQIVVQ